MSFPQLDIELSASAQKKLKLIPSDRPSSQTSHTRFLSTQLFVAQIRSQIAILDRTGALGTASELKLWSINNQRSMIEDCRSNMSCAGLFALGITKYCKTSRGKSCNLQMKIALWCFRLKKAFLKIYLNYKRLKKYFFFKMLIMWGHFLKQDIIRKDILQSHFFDDHKTSINCLKTQKLTSQTIGRPKKVRETPESGDDRKNLV